MKTRNSIRNEINEIYQSKVVLWLTEHVKNNHEIQGFPFRIILDAPAKEEEVNANKEQFLLFCNDWHGELAAGKVEFVEKEFRGVGRIEVPVHLVFDTPDEIVSWCGHLVEYRTALKRLDIVAERIPVLVDSALEHIANLTSLEDLDFMRFVEVCRWILKNPNSGSMIRQMRIRGVDSAWFERFRNFLLLFLRDNLRLNPLRKDLRQLGLIPPPSLIRIVILDPKIREHVGNLRYIACPVAEAAKLSVHPDQVLFMEDLASALSLPDAPSTVAVILPNSALGEMCSISWIAKASTVYLGSIGIDALLRLNNLRVHLPRTQSRLLDEATFFANEDLWTPDFITKEAVPMQSPLLLNRTESELYQLFLARIIKKDSMNIVQERIPFELLCQAAGITLPVNDEHLHVTEEKTSVMASAPKEIRQDPVKEQTENSVLANDVASDVHDDVHDDVDEEQEISDLESL